MRAYPNIFEALINLSSIKISCHARGWAGYTRSCAVQACLICGGGCLVIIGQCW